MRWALFLLCIVVPAPVHSATPLSLADVTSFQARLRKSVLALRPPANSSATVYVSTPSGTARYVYRNPSVFRLTTPMQVTRPSLAPSLPNRIRLRLKNPRLSTITLDFYSPGGMPFDSLALATVLADALVLPGSLPDIPPVIGNTLSHVAHARGCNHLPDSTESLPFASRTAAERLGYRLCPICFCSLPPIQDYAMELAIGRRQAASVLSGASISDIDSQNARVERVGRVVLEKWPVPLRGYSYTFRVLDDPTLNACACAGGRVFVNTGLLATCESDRELEAVIAHEITHVERRHAYQQFRQAADNQAAGFLAELLLGAAVAAATNDASTVNTVMQVADIITTVASEIAQVGHSRVNEEEADAYALAYLSTARHIGSTTPLFKVLYKLQYAQTIGGLAGVGPAALMSHPFIDDRIEKARKMQVELLPPGVRYVGMGKDSVPLVAVTFTTKTLVEYKEVPSVTSLSAPTTVHEIRLLGTMEGLDDLERPIPLKYMSVTFGGLPLVLDNYEDTRVYPGAVVAFSVFAKGPTSFGSLDLRTASFAVPGVLTWRRLSEE
jgi:Zn-dependent protease with chaperone function